MGCLHDSANVQQTTSKCIQNTRANAGRLLDSVNTLLLITHHSPVLSLHSSVFSHLFSLPISHRNTERYCKTM